MYEAFYRLSAKPFQLNPDPSFFYCSKGHTRAMSYLEYGLHQGEGFIVITGDVGAGKTMLVRNLFRTLIGQNLVAANLVSTQLDADDMLRSVAAAFGLPHEVESKAVLLRKLEVFLQQLLRDGKRALLVVDEAQNLTPRAVEELRMLSNFQLDGQSLLQSFLLGQPEFRRTMQSDDMLQLRQRVTASYHLGPMDAQETREYILHRLRTVNWHSDPTFGDDAFRSIFEYSRGIPRKINTLCDRLLLMGYLDERHHFDMASVQQVMSELRQELDLTTEDLDKSKRTAANDPSPSGGNVTRMPDPKHVVSVIENQLEVETSLARMEQRLTQVEKSVISVLKMMRQVLSMVGGVKRPRGDERPELASVGKK